MVVEFITNAEVFYRTSGKFNTTFFRAGEKEAWAKVGEFVMGDQHYVYLAVGMCLVLMGVWKVVRGRKGESLQQDKKKLFKENINKIFKADEEF